MNDVEELVEQHILASQSKLRHIDELMKRARRGASSSADPGDQALLSEIDANRARLAADVAELRRTAPPATTETVQRVAGVRAALEATGRQMEAVLASIFASPER